jgi:hypothetical protein
VEISVAVSGCLGFGVVFGLPPLARSGEKWGLVPPHTGNSATGAGNGLGIMSGKERERMFLRMRRPSA